jgi:hypothetical protein
MTVPEVVPGAADAGLAALASALELPPPLPQAASATAPAAAPAAATPVVRTVRRVVDSELICVHTRRDTVRFNGSGTDSGLNQAG